MKATFTLYKYTPHINEFLKIPMLRATPAYALNDPFELKVDTHSAGMLGERKHFTEHSLGGAGVVSLCETKDNLLMWSHYADEHRGGVIEFTFELNYFNEDTVTTNFFKGGIGRGVAANNFIFDRVKYRHSREPESNTFEMSSWKRLRQLKKHLSFIKADTWSYEKEHRFLCELTSASSVALQRPSDDKKVDALKDKLDELEIPYSDNASKILLSDFCRWLKEMEYAMNLNILKDYCRANNISLFHFFDIDPATVTGIYLGCESKQPLTLTDPIFDKFTNLNANVKKAELSNERYELVFNALP